MKSDLPGAAKFLPADKSLPSMRDAVQDCKGCDLYEFATQAVFSEGKKRAPIAFIGEQPGSEEDIQGRPFVGPAGKLFDRALKEAGIDRSKVYITNAVKHFKFEERGKRRIHKKPTTGETKACRPWLEAEMFIVKPEVLVCLGATAALSVFGPAYRVTKERGTFVEHPWCAKATSTIHPSAVLRALPEDREREFQLLVDDLKKIAKASK